MNQSTGTLTTLCYMNHQETSGFTMISIHWQRMLIIIFFTTAAAQLIVSIICTQLNLGHLAPCS